MRFAGVTDDPRFRAIWYGTIQWVRNAALGLTPWFAYSLTHLVATSNGAVSALCYETAARSTDFFRFADKCIELPDSPAQEICILAVVISGLSLLSIGAFQPGRREVPRTAFTNLMQVLTFGSLMAGACFYGQISGNLDLDRAGHHLTQPYAEAALAVALVSSLFLDIRESYFSLIKQPT